MPARPPDLDIVSRLLRPGLLLGFGSGRLRCRCRRLTISLEGELTPLGTLELACVEQDSSEPKRFGLAFDLRSGPDVQAAERRSTRPPPSRASAAFEEAQEACRRVFGKGRSDVKPREVKDLWRTLERLLKDKSSWTTDVNRALFDTIAPHRGARKRSADHERVFWNLAGYTLRPGYGCPGDDKRVARLAPAWSEGVAFRDEARSWQQLWIALRRIAGGLNEETQSNLRRLADPYLAPADAGLKRPKKFRPQALKELLGNELLPRARRRETARHPRQMAARQDVDRPRSSLVDVDWADRRACADVR